MRFIVQRIVPTIPIVNNNEDSISARNRDVKIREMHRSNWRADVILFFAYIGTILPIIAILLFNEHLKEEELVICSTLVSIFGSIVTDAALFEFGNNSNREDKKKK